MGEQQSNSSPNKGSVTELKKISVVCQDMNYLLPQFKVISSLIAFKIPCLQINTISTKVILQIQSFLAVYSVKASRSVSSNNYFCCFVERLLWNWKNHFGTIMSAQLCAGVENSSLKCCLFS